MTILKLFLCFISGVLLNMAMVHLFNFAETSHHPIIARSKHPHMASTLWSLGYLFSGCLALMLVHFRFEISLDALAIFLGFAAWAIFLATIAERRKP